MVEAAAAVALALLAVAGMAKVVEPQYTSGALRATGLPSAIWIVRALGIAEVMAGIAGLVFGGPSATPAAFFYASFAFFTANALRGDVPLQSCGCLGREDTPPSVLHVVFNLVAASALTAAAIANLSPIPTGNAFDTAIYVGMVGLGTIASALLMTRLPAVLRLARSA